MTLKRFEDLLNDILFMGYFEGSADDLYNRWIEPHRHFHTMKNHMEKILSLIDDYYSTGKLTKFEYDILRLVTIYHDIVYLPRKDSFNVEESAEKFKEDFPELPNSLKETIVKIILSTIEHDFEQEDKLCRIFNLFDMYGVLHNDIDDLIRDNNLVMAEYMDHIDFELFRKNNINFLSRYIKYNPELVKLINYMKKLYK